MDIPNLNPNPIITIPEVKKISVSALFILSILALSLGFWGSRLINSKNNSVIQIANNTLITNPDTITDQSQITSNKLYGNLSKAFKDSATGTIEKGSINGEGTHILNRAGGVSQRASLTSSVIDLDLFVGKKVEVKGETNASTKTSWLLDVGTIKIIE